MNTLTVQFQWEDKTVRERTLSVSSDMQKARLRIPRQQKFREFNGAHLASPIRRELVMLIALVGHQIYCPVGHHIWGPTGKEIGRPNFALTVGKFVLSDLS